MIRLTAATIVRTLEFAEKGIKGFVTGADQSTAKRLVSGSELVVTSRQQAET